MPDTAPRPSARPARLGPVAGVALAALLAGGGTYVVTSAARGGVEQAAPVGAAGTPAPRRDLDPRDAAATSFPGLVAATGEPTLPGIADAAGAPGDVGFLAGPFDDRFRWIGPRLDAGTVTGGLDVTSDVSTLLELQILAAFYDRDGHLLGTRRSTYHLDEGQEHAEDGPPVETRRFRLVAPPAWRARVSSAAVGVPVLVNE